MGVSLTVLSYDHGYIQQVIDVLQVASERYSLENYRQHMICIVEFLEKFMDVFHHGKEEKFLFPAAARSSPALASEIQTLISDHRHARNLLKTMALELKEGGNKEKYHELAQELARHMTAHIRKEEDVLFPEIEKNLTPEEDRNMSRDFDSFTVRLFYKISREFAGRIQDDMLGPGFYEGKG